MLIFSYGSNMCLGRLKERVPSAQFYKVGHLLAHRLEFHKYSKLDQSGKANAFFSDSRSDIVFGVIYRIADSEKALLDRAEGLGHGYTEKQVKVILPDGEGIPVQVYTAEPAAIDDSLKPYDWYIDYVLTGARDYKLDTEYIQKIEAVQPITDPKGERTKKEREILASHIKSFSKS